MRRLHCLWLPLLIAAGSTVALPASAVGFGVFMEPGVATGEWEIEDEFDERDFDADNARLTLGFLFDTSPGSERLFAYRLKVGIAKYESDFDETFGFFDGLELDLGGLVLDHTLGFGLVRTESVRVWMGPTLRTAFYAGELEGLPSGSLSNDAWVFEFGAGAALGANFHVGEDVDFGTELGFRFLGNGGEVDWDSPDLEDYDIKGSFAELYLNFSVVFRFGSDRT